VLTLPLRNCMILVLSTSPVLSPWRRCSDHPAPMASQARGSVSRPGECPVGSIPSRRRFDVGPRLLGGDSWWADDQRVRDAHEYVVPRIASTRPRFLFEFTTFHGPSSWCVRRNISFLASV